MLPLILAAVFVLPLTTAGIFGFAQYQEYQEKQATREQEYKQLLQASLLEITALKERSEQLEQSAQQQSQELNQKLQAQADQQKKVQEETQQEIIKAQQEAQKQAELARLQAKQQADQQVKDLEQKLTESGYNLTLIIEEWSPIIGKVKCEFRYSNTNVLYQTTSGSGIVVMSPSEFSPKVFTNKHVLTDSEGYYPDTCTVKVPNNAQTYHFYTNNITPSSSADFASATIIDSDIALRNLGLSYADKPICTARPSIGEKVVILGYPGIGSQSSITATEGIVSGYDGSYFITSAKVEQGNSGGAAVLTKSNCLLGIPTVAKVGSIESLARILDINSVLQ